MGLHDLYLRYRDRVQFLVIYIREAHPVDGWWLGGGITGQLTTAIVSGGKTGQLPKAATDVYDPKTTEARQAVARRCELALKYEIHTYVDVMDDAVSKAYAAHPTRLYLVGLIGDWFMPEELDRLASNQQSLAKPLKNTSRRRNN